MADIDSQLPVRSVADGTDERVHVKIVDYTDPDGVDKQVQVSEKKIHNRNFNKDSDGNDQEVLVSQEGHSLTNGDYDATNNKRPSSQGLIASDRNATPSESTMNQRPTAVSGDNDKVAVDVAISDSDGNHFSNSNPLPVSIEESAGEEVHEHFESAADIAKNNSDDQSYTVTALKDLQLEQWGVSGSGFMKGELFIETGVATGVFTSKGVLFNSTAMPNAQIVLKRMIKVSAGVIVKITRTNLDNQAQCMYSFLNGIEN